MLERPTPLQADLFTGELVDTRSRDQRRADRDRQQPQQQLLFSQREIAQFGVRSNPVMPFSPGKLQLISEDPRSEDEIEQDRLREAQRQTTPMFAEPMRETTSSLSQPTLTPSLTWLNRDDLVKCRPDLAGAIEKLGDQELEVIGTLLLSALQELYRIQLDLILTLYFQAQIR
jgi:hypothetical protein